MNEADAEYAHFRDTIAWALDQLEQALDALDTEISSANAEMRALGILEKDGSAVLQVRAAHRPLEWVDDENIQLVPPAVIKRADDANKARDRFDALWKAISDRHKFVLVTDENGHTERRALTWGLLILEEIGRGHYTRLMTDRHVMIVPARPN